MDFDGRELNVAATDTNGYQILTTALEKYLRDEYGVRGPGDKMDQHFEISLDEVVNRLGGSWVEIDPATGQGKFGAAYGSDQYVISLVPGVSAETISIAPAPDDTGVLVGEEVTLPVHSEGLGL